MGGGGGGVGLALLMHNTDNIMMTMAHGSINEDINGNDSIMAITTVMQWWWWWLFTLLLRVLMRRVVVMMMMDQAQREAPSQGQQQLPVQ